MQSPERRRFLAARGALPTLLAQLVAAADACASRCTGAVDRQVDEPLRALSALAASFLELRDVRARLLRQGLAPALLRCAIVCRTAALASDASGTASAAAASLAGALARTSADSPAAAAAVVAACVAALREEASDTTLRSQPSSTGASPAAALVLSQLVAVLCPVKPAPVYAVQLIKAHTQEEFIRGSCGRAPIQRCISGIALHVFRMPDTRTGSFFARSTAFDGPLMRDVKNFICRTLDLQGLIDDDYGLELLVDGYVRPWHVLNASCAEPACCPPGKSSAWMCRWPLCMTASGELPRALGRRRPQGRSSTACRG